MKRRKLFSLVLALVLLLSFVTGCSRGGDDRYETPNEKDAVSHTDHTSVYERIGKDVTIDMVNEDENGLAYVTIEDVTYTLGMDFLSMAMVYNTQIPENSKQYTSTEDVFNAWWRLYIQRWNYLVPEVPLYSNQYFDLYNAKLENFVTTPYRSVADAIVSAKIRRPEENAVILGSITDLSGAFRSASWGKSSPGASDLDIENLTTGYATVMTNAEGAFVWNRSALAKEPISHINEDGTLTYTLTIRKDLLFSDGSPISAKHYIVGLLANSTPVAVEAGGSGQAGLRVKGFEVFSAYGGEEATGASRYFEGVRLIDDHTFSITFKADYADYYYTMSYAAFSPSPLGLYLGDGAIIVNEDGLCGLSDTFYETEQREGRVAYKTSAQIEDNLAWDSPYPYSGPYTVYAYDPATLTATLKRNLHYNGDDVRGEASIDTITYIKVVSETQMDMFASGQVDVVAGITGGTDTKNALLLVAQGNGRYKETHYDRAGYGKLGFRCDFGPTGMVEVRQAVLYTINRPEFAATFTGGYGSVVNGPYYSGYAAYKASEALLNLNPYNYSVDNAIKALEAGGWVYNEKGEAFDATRNAIRYKKLSGYELSKENLFFRSVDGKYKTVKIDGAYYMPLVINWYGTQPNEVTDQLITAWQKNPNATNAIGMYITFTECDFNGGLYGEYQRNQAYGYDGTPKLGAINFASGFTSAAYDYSFNWTLDPAKYDVYSISYLKDEADYFENYR